MDALLRIIREFPALWAFLGLLVGGSVAYAVSLKFTPMYGKALKEFDILHDDMVDAYKAQIADLKAEKEDYKKKLHDEKGHHHHALLRISEMEARPNVDKVYEGQQEFFTSMTVAMKELTVSMRLIHTSIMDHDIRVAERTAEAMDKIKGIVNGGKT